MFRMPRDVGSLTYEELLADSIRRATEVWAFMDDWYPRSPVKAEVITIRDQMVELQRRGRQGTLEGL